jgi:hypothetical protein
MFGIRDDMSREMAEFRDSEKARIVTINLKNDDGLRLDDTRVNQTVDFAMEGGGAIRAVTKTRNRFNSSKKGKKIQVKIIKEVDHSSISSIIALAIDTIFGGTHE